jgi:hypothetical protein
MLGSRAAVAATCGGIGFHERESKRELNEVIEVVESSEKLKLMGKVPEPFANGGQGKNNIDERIHDRARNKRERVRQNQIAPFLLPQYERPDAQPAPCFPDIEATEHFQNTQNNQGPDGPNQHIQNPVQLQARSQSPVNRQWQHEHIQHFPKPGQVQLQAPAEPTQKNQIPDVKNPVQAQHQATVPALYPAVARYPAQHTTQSQTPAQSQVLIQSPAPVPETHQRLLKTPVQTPIQNQNPAQNPAPAQQKQLFAQTQHQEQEFPGLLPPALASGARVDGSNKRQMRRENKQRRIREQEEQEEASYWRHYKGDFVMPLQMEGLQEWKGSMCPSNLALHHPAAAKLLQYATGGCPCNTGKPWTKSQMWAAVERGPHVSALQQEAIDQLKGEIAEKVRVGQCRVVEWDSIKDNPPEQLKVSPLAMIPHKSRQFRAILDLSFRIRLKDGSTIPSVNETTTLEAPAGAIDQLGHSLQRIIHAFAEADEDAKIFMAKYDIKDGFWRLDCAEGEEWNFAYVLPQDEGEPVRLVVPTSLQMGWVESPPYFCAASETACDVATQYAELPIGSLTDHKFSKFTMTSDDMARLPDTAENSELRYFNGVYVDDFLNMAIATSKEQLQHVSNAVMHAIHDVFPADSDDENDPISLKKLKKKEGEWALLKEMLGFDFDGLEKTMILSEVKRELLLAILHRWKRTMNSKTAAIPFKEFESVLQKVRHAFTAIPEGKGLMTPCNKIMRKQPEHIFLGRNERLSVAIRDMTTLLKESTKAPTKCKELVMGHPDYVGVKDASIHGVGGIIVGENKACVPTVFRMEWPKWVKDEVLKTNSGQKGNLTNSDLEMAGLLLLFLVMEEVCDLQPGDHIALFSDNSPTVSWVRRMASRGSLVADQLLRALTLRMKLRQVSPLTTLHIEGKKNAMTDIPSRSFGSEKKWLCKTEAELLTLFNASFPFPDQNTWTVFRPSQKIESRIFSALQRQVLKMEEWRRLPKPGRFTGEIGRATAKQWEWTLTFREQASMTTKKQCTPTQQQCELDTTVKAVQSEVQRFQRRSRPLTRRSLWPQTGTHSR